MRFGVLGPLAVWTSAGDPVLIPGLKVRALLAALLVNEGRSVTADRLIEDIWGDDPPKQNPPGALSAKVSQLRRAFDEAEPGSRELVVYGPPGYHVRLTEGVVDVQRFQALVEQARGTDDPRSKASLLGEALGLWRGPAYADFADETFTEAVIARLEEQRLTVLEDAALARLELGEHTALAAELGELVNAHPLRERLRAAHMRALYGAGRQTEALDSFEELRRQLDDELGLDPSAELASLQQAILLQDPSLAGPAPRSRSNLPAPLTPLIGRDEAVAEIRSILDDAERLVTLTGSGGVGKTRLAIETATQLAGTFPDGAWMVELTSGAAEEVVMAALEIRDSGEPEPLLAALRSRRMLLVLDNCEHMIDEVAALAEKLLRAAPGLRLLATSREPLGLAGEVVWSVSPLEEPSAVELFVSRASAAQRGFKLTEEDEKAVELLCRRLDGIPLALELAATRVRALGVQGVVSRLDDRFRLLATGHRGAPPRQQTLMAMIDWSWELLSPEEQLVLRRLAVHSDGCTVEAAEAVCAEEGLDVLDLLIRLVDRSLVVVSGDSRYRLLESVAAYCTDKLQQAGELSELRQRHVRYYLDYASQGASHLEGPEQTTWLHRLDAETPNLRTALSAASQEDGLKLATSLVWYWFLRGRFTEARRALEAVGESAWSTGFARLKGEAASYDGEADGRTAWFLGYTALQQGDLAGGEALLDRAQATFTAEGDRWGKAVVTMTRASLGHIRGDLDALEREARISANAFHDLGDRWGYLRATEWLGGHAEMIGDYERAASLHEEGRRLAEELGLWPEVSARLSWLGWIAIQQGDYETALKYGRDALLLAGDQSTLSVFPEIVLGFAARRAGDFKTAEFHLDNLLGAVPDRDGSPPLHLTMILTELGYLAELRGDAETALALHREALEVADKLEAPRDRAGALEGLAGAISLAGDHVAAARALGEASVIRDDLPLSPAERPDLARTELRCREALGQKGFSEEFDHGRIAALSDK